MDKTAFSTKRADLFIIIISSLMMLVVLNLPFKAKPFGDITFFAEAKNMALFLKGQTTYDHVMITKAPGPVIYYTPAFMLAPSDASDHQYWVYGVSFSAIMITISLLLIFRAALGFFSKEIAFLSVLLFFIFPIHCYYSLGILAETPAFFSLSLVLYGWSVAFRKPEKLAGWIWITLGIWFLILNRPNAMLLLGVGFLVVLYAWFRNKNFFETYGKKTILVLFAVGISGFGALQLSKMITGNKSQGNQDGLLYYVALQGRFQFREEPTDFRFWDNDYRADSKDYQNWGKAITELSAKAANTNRSRSEVFREFLINDALEHPLLFTRQFFVKCFYGHVYFINSVKPEKFKLGPFQGALGYSVFILLINLINIIIIFGAVLFLLRQKNLIHFWPFWGIIVSLLIFHGLTYMEPRYMFPSKAALYIMSAAGLYRIGLIQRSVDWVSLYLFPKINPV